MPSELSSGTKMDIQVSLLRPVKTNPSKLLETGEAIKGILKPE